MFPEANGAASSGEQISSYRDSQAQAGPALPSRRDSNIQPQYLLFTGVDANPRTVFKFYSLHILQESLPHAAHGWGSYLLSKPHGNRD